MKSCVQDRKLCHEGSGLSLWRARGTPIVTEDKRRDLDGLRSRYNPLKFWARPPPRPEPPLPKKKKLAKVLELHLHCFVELLTCRGKSMGGGGRPA